MDCDKSWRRGILMLIWFLVVAGTGCQPRPARQPQLEPVMAFIARISSNGPDQSPSEYTVVFDSGRVVRFSSERDLCEATLSASDAAALADALALSGLGTLPEVSYYPPDGAHSVIGVRWKGELRRYAWTGDPQIFGESISTGDAAFIDAWSKARAALAQRLPGTWTPVKKATTEVEQLLAKIGSG